MSGRQIHPIIERFHEFEREQDNTRRTEVKKLSKEARRFIVREGKGLTVDVGLFALGAHGVAGRDYGAKREAIDSIQDLAEKAAGQIIAIKEGETVTKMARIPHFAPLTGEIKGINRLTEGGLFLPADRIVNVWDNHFTPADDEGRVSLAYAIPTHSSDLDGTNGVYADISSRADSILVGAEEVYAARPAMYFWRNHGRNFDQAMDLVAAFE